MTDRQTDRQTARPTDRPIRILIADDHPIFRDGLRKLLETQEDFSVVGEASDGEEAVDQVKRLKPDILLLDLAMPRVPGLEALVRLKVPNTVKTIVLAAAIDQNDMVRALQLGVRGVVLKETATELLLKSIRRVMAGEYWVGREVVSDLVAVLGSIQAAAERRASGKGFGLTSRERAVLGLVVAGYTNKDLAAKLGIAEDTVKHHLTNIFNKTGASNRLELALFAIHHQLAEL